MKFGDEYPLKAPEVRFITPVYHCNINSTGRICHSVLDQFYTVDTTARYILECIFGLFMIPEPLDPLDANIAAEYRDNYVLYESKAREHTRKYAGKSLDDLTRNLVSSETENNPPKHMLDPITGKIMTDPVVVRKSNTCYQREVIERIIDMNHTDPFSGVIISRADLVSNVTLKKEIDEYNLALKTPWFL